MLREDQQLSSAWPKTAGRRESSTLFHRTNGGSGIIDVSDIRGGGDVEEGRGEAGEPPRDEDSPSPPRVPRRLFSKRVGSVAAARRNGALCLALCVSAASLVWIIARDETGPKYTGIDTLGPWAHDQHSTGKKRTSASMKVDARRMPKDHEQGAEKKGGDRSMAGFRRAAEEEPGQRQRQRRRSEQAQARRTEKFARHQQQKQSRLQADAAAAAVAADALVARDAAETAVRAAVSDGSFVPATQSGERGVSAQAHAGPSGDGRARREEAGRGWRSGAYPAGGGGGGGGGVGGSGLAVEDGGGTVGKTRRAVGGEEEEEGDGSSAPAAERDVEGVGRWGAFEDVPADDINTGDFPIDDGGGGGGGGDDKRDSEETTVARAARAVAEAPPNDNVGGIGATTAEEEEERPPKHDGGAGAPSGGAVDPERPAGRSGRGGGGGGRGGMPDESKPVSESEGNPPTMPTAVASGEVEGEQDLQQQQQQQRQQQRGQAAVTAERPQGKETVAAGGGSGGVGAEASPSAKRVVGAEPSPSAKKGETSREGAPRDEEEQREGEEGGVGEDGEIARTETETPVEEDRRETKAGDTAGAQPEAAEAAAARLRAAAAETGGATTTTITTTTTTTGTTTTKSKKGASATSDSGAAASAETQSGGDTSGIREANKRAKEIRASTRGRPASNAEKVKKATPEQAHPAAVAGGALPEQQAKAVVLAKQRADVRVPSRHADRWEQARKARKAGGEDGDKSAVIGRGKHETGASASASTAAVHFAQAAAEAALVGIPPLLPGGGGERGGTRGADGGVGLPCRLEGRVEDWKPPAIADLRSSYRWADEQKASMDRIRRFRQGGVALRELIHAEVIRLDVLRHDLFC